MHIKIGREFVSLILAPTIVLFMIVTNSHTSTRLHSFNSSFILLLCRPQSHSLAITGRVNGYANPGIIGIRRDRSLESPLSYA